MHGSDRNKSTLFWASDDLFSSLAVICDGSHPHASWKPVWQHGGWRYPTADEAAYPWLLCERIAHLLAAEYPDLADTAYQVRLPDQVALQRQPRYAKPLVSAFALYDTWAVPVTGQASDLLLKAYPKGARVVRRKLVPWGVVRVCLPSMCTLLDRQALKRASVSDKSFAIMDGECGAGADDLGEDPADVCKVVGEIPPNNGCAESAELVQIGIPREPHDFVNEAIKAGHPRDMLSICRSGPAREVAEAVLYSKESRLAEARRTFSEWIKIKERTSQENVEMLKNRPEYIRKVLGGKNLLFWKQALQDCGFPDTELWWDMCQGFRLTGWMPDTKLFARYLRPPTSSLEKLLSQSSYRTPLTLQAINKTVVDEASTGAWLETCEEERKGWIFRDEHYNPEKVVLCHRFGLQRRDKVRVIDNGKMSGLNEACGLPEKFLLHGVDTIAAALLEIMSRTDGRTTNLMGKTYDLVSAYKFFPVHPSDREHVRLGVFDVDHRVPAVYGTNVLTFGATGSVAGFLRVSNAIRDLGLRSLKIPWLAYFDDFPVLSCGDSCDDMEELVDQLFGLLDVEYAKTGKKAVKFAPMFAALGLLFDLSEFDSGVVTIRHTEKRKTEILGTLDQALKENALSAKQAEILRGRLHWFNSYLFGRAPCEAMHRLSVRAQGRDSSTALDASLEGAIRTFKDHLENAPPLRLCPASGRNMYILTDGSFEPGLGTVAGIGGVLYDQSGNPVQYFSSEIAGEDLKRLLGDSDHSIYEVELAAVMVAFEIWKELLQDTYSTFYIDNEAAQSALVSGRSGTRNGRFILQRILNAERSSLCRPWYGRVPSHSNPADPPSRNDCAALEASGAKRAEVRVPGMLFQRFEAMG